MGFERNRAYLTDTGGSELIGLKILSVKVNRNIQVQEQPVEDGSQRQDTKVRKPITASLECACYSEDWDSLKNQVAKMYKEKTSKTCTLCTKVEVLKNMALTSFPYDLDPENYDTLFFSIELQEIVVVGGKTDENDSITAASNAENNSSSSSSSVSKPASQTETNGVMQQAAQSNPGVGKMVA